MKKTYKLRLKIYNFLIFGNIIIYSFFIAMFLKGGVSYAENLPILHLNGDYPLKIAVTQVIVSQRSNSEGIIDPPKANFFPWGQCTWYVATKRNVAWNGNAKDWYGNAKKAGRKVGAEPKRGSIVVLNEGYYGHVGYVEDIAREKFTFSESNNPIPGKITIKTLGNKDPSIIGFIY